MININYGKKVLIVFFIAFSLAIHSQENRSSKNLNLDFENIEKGTPAGWQPRGKGYRFSMDSVFVKSGKYSVVIESMDGSPQFGVLGLIIRENYKGKKITLSGYIKTENVTDGYASLLMRIDPEVGVGDVKIKGTTEWKKYEVSVDMNPAKTQNFAVAVMLVGKGKVWFDDLKISIDDPNINELTSYNTPDTCVKLTAMGEYGLLWKISGKGLEKPSYLFGTYHGTNAIGVDFLDSIPEFYNIFNSVMQYAGECDMEANMDLIKEAQTMYLGQLLMPSDTVYADLLPDADLHYLDSILMKYMHRTSEQVNIAPNYLGMVITQMQINVARPEGLSAPSEESMDVYLMKMAKKRNYRIFELDSADIYFRTYKIMYGENLHSTSLEESATHLIRILKSQSDSFLNSLRDIENAYRHFDLIGLEQSKAKSNKIFKEIDSKDSDPDFNLDLALGFLLKERNERWMAKIPELISEKSTFIGVGIIHLVGEAGLINQLRKLGCTVEPVK